VCASARNEMRGRKGGGEIAGGGSEHVRQGLFVGHFMCELEIEVE